MGSCTDKLSGADPQLFKGLAEFFSFTQFCDHPGCLHAGCLWYICSSKYVVTQECLGIFICLLKQR